MKARNLASDLRTLTDLDVARRCHGLRTTMVEAADELERQADIADEMLAALRYAEEVLGPIAEADAECDEEESAYIGAHNTVKIAIAAAEGETNAEG